MFRLRAGERIIHLHPGVWEVGRLPTAGVFVNDAEVSRQHALLHAGEKSLVLEDLGSRNGTFVNGVQVVGKFALRTGDRLRFGSAIEFMLEDDTARPPRTPSSPKDFTPVNQVPGTYPGSGERPPSVTQPPAESDPLVRGPTPTLEIPRSGISVTKAPSAPARASVLLCLADADWASRLHRALGVEPNFAPQIVGSADIQRVVATATPGCLFLDVDLVGSAVSKVLKAWWGTDRRRGPVMLVSKAPEHEGVVLARNLGAQAYVRSGKSADMVVAQVRYQIQRATAGGGAKK